MRLRKRYTLLIEKLKKTLIEEKVSSDVSDDEKALDEILETEADAGNTLESDKKKADNGKAVEMPQKRKAGDDVGDVENVQPKPKLTRRSGEDTVAYLREKMIWFRNGT